jgi:hypothetical protein
MPIAATANLSTPFTRALAAQTSQQIVTIINASTKATSCDSCKAGLVVAQALAKIAPWEVPNVMIELCNAYKYDVCTILATWCGWRTNYAAVVRDVRSKLRSVK